MFGLDELKKTRYFQEVTKEAEQKGMQQGKLETVPKLLKFGLTVEQVAEAIGLSVEQVREAAGSSD